jgi:hypothetical protein
MMNDIKNLTGGRLDAKAAHIAAEQMRASDAPNTYTARLARQHLKIGSK